MDAFWTDLFAWFAELNRIEQLGVVGITSAIIGGGGFAGWTKGLFSFLKRRKASPARARDDLRKSHREIAADLIQRSEDNAAKAAVESQRADSAELRISELEETINALSSGTDPREQQALDLLADGMPDEAEHLLRAVAEDREKDVAKAASAYRHLGSIAFLVNTKRAHEAYLKATRFDPLDIDSWNRLARLDLRLGNLEAADRGFTEVLRLAQDQNQDEYIAVAFGNLGIVKQVTGDLEQAEHSHSQALAANKRLKLPRAIATNLGNLGAIALMRGNNDRSYSLFSQALEINRAEGVEEGIAGNEAGLGIVEKTRGNLDAAESHQQRALAINDRLGRLEEKAKDLGNLGLVAFQRGRMEEAKQFHELALQIDKEIHHKQGIADDLGNLGAVAHSMGDTQKAIELVSQSLTANQEMGNALGISTNLAALGYLEAAGGNWKKAYDYYQNALELAESQGFLPLIEQIQVDMQLPAGKLRTPES